MRLFLASLSLAGLPEFLGASARRVAWVPSAADPLEDRDRVRALFAAMLDELGLSLLPCELDRDDDPTIAARLAAVDAVIVTGGDPFHLLARAKKSGFDRAVREAVRGGLPYVGVSAGAILAGPSLEPHVLTSSFARAPGQALDALALTSRVVLPHHDRDENALLHDVAKQQFARFDLCPLRDDEALIVENGETRIARAS